MALPTPIRSQPARATVKYPGGSSGRSALSADGVHRGDHPFHRLFRHRLHLRFAHAETPRAKALRRRPTTSGCGDR
jgi:hypothetical protein